MRPALIILLSFTFLQSCRKDKNTKLQYVPGEIVVGIKDSVPIDKVFNLLNSYQLEIGEIFRYTYNAPFPDDSASIVQTYLQDKPYVNKNWAHVVEDAFYIGNYETQVKIGFKKLTLADQQDWLSTVSELRLVDEYRSTPGKFSIVYVPKGEEKKWCETLTTADIVSFAKLREIPYSERQ